VHSTRRRKWKKKFTSCLLAHGRWFFPGTPASSTTKTGRHDIAEILLKVALTVKHNKHNSRCKIYIFSRVHNASEPYIFVLKVSNKKKFDCHFRVLFPSSYVYTLHWLLEISLRIHE